MRFACLGSGSEGNAVIVEAGPTRVLVDCGFPLRETIFRLARLGIEPESLDGIVVTHEHADHVSGVPPLAARFDLPVWLTFGTLAASFERFEGLWGLNAIDSHEGFAIGALRFEPIAVPHDAREPVQFVCTDGAWRLGILTDLGMPTPYVEMRVSGCHGLLLECNHDADLLASGDYPHSLKQRIAGRYGHLDNGSAAAILSRIERARLQHVVAAHLSRDNNRPDLARAALASALDCAPEWIGVADQSDGLEWRAFVA